MDYIKQDFREGEIYIIAKDYMGVSRDLTTASERMCEQSCWPVPRHGYAF